MKQTKQDSSVPIMDAEAIRRALRRVAHEIVERNPDLKSVVLALMGRYTAERQFMEVIPISARTGDGVSLLIEKLFEYLPEGAPMYAEDELTDQPERIHLVVVLAGGKAQ